MRYSRLPLFLALALTGACGTRHPFEGKSVAELERMLQDESPTVQAQGALGLSRLGPEAASAVPALTRALQGPHVLVREKAALALGQVGSKDGAAALIDALRDRKWAVRRQAALALGRIGPESPAARQALDKLRQDPERLVRKAAAEALQQLPKPRP